jgi:hypothetical protein
MATLKKVFVAYFFERKSKRPFHSDKVVASSFEEALEIAEEWGTNKFNGRLVNVIIEKSRKGGEVISAD